METDLRTDTMWHFYHDLLAGMSRRWWFYVGVLIGLAIGHFCRS